jgi:hypothetical protein
VLGLCFYALLVGEIVRPSPLVDGACGAALWPVMVGTTACMGALAVLDWVHSYYYYYGDGPDIDALLLQFSQAVLFVRMAVDVGFAIALTVVVQSMGINNEKCMRALEVDATVTHSYALAVVAWLALVLHWLGFVASIFRVCQFRNNNKHFGGGGGGGGQPQPAEQYD